MGRKERDKEGKKEVSEERRQVEEGREPGKGN